jgi:hypothetical protein
MHERNLVAAEPGPRRRLDDVRPLRSKIADGLGDVVHGEAHVVHPGPAVRQKTPDRRGVLEGRDELDATRAQAEVHGLDALIVQAAAQLDLGAEQGAICLHGLVEVLDREGDVVDVTHVHAADPIRRAWFSVGQDDGLRSAHTVGRVRLGLDVDEKRFELVAQERLSLEQGGGDAVE